MLGFLSNHLIKLYAALLLLVVLLHLAGLLESLGLPLLAVVTTVSVVAMAASLALRRPKPLWPWVVVVLSMLLMLGSGSGGPSAAISGIDGTPHDYTSSLLSWPGHLGLVLGLAAMTRSGRFGVSRDALLDAAVVALSVLLLLWSFLVAPRVAGTELPLLAQVLLPMHAALTAFMLSLTFFVLTRGERSMRGNLSALGLLLSFSLLEVGNLLYLTEALDLLPFLSQHWRVPFSLVAILFVLSLLHPSVARVVEPGAPPPAAGAGRVLVAVLALLLPATVVVRGSDGVYSTRLVSGLIVLALITVSVARLVTILRSHLAARQSMEHRALHDPLTGLPNRAQTFITLEAEIALPCAPSSELAVLFLDLDRFKHVNDSLGHKAGDELLVQVSSRLKDLTPSGATVSRLAGDEFVIVIPRTQEDQAHAIASAVCRYLAEPFELELGEARIGSSVGLALHRGGEVTPSQLLHRADTALYQAKLFGRGRVVVYNHDLEAAAIRRNEVEEGLRTALERDELYLVYQPQVSALDGRVRGCEALLRWRSAELGEVSPDEFVPVAEESGLMASIGKWAMEQACDQVASWRGSIDPQLRVSVNLSTRQVAAPSFPEAVRRTLSLRGLDPAALELEMTESLVSAARQETEESLAALDELGVSLALDNFGSGQSSLAHLRQHPISVVKIDRALVSGLLESETDLSLVTAIIAMSSAFGVSVVAEGVETVEQAGLLRAMGCGFLQGWTTSRPVSSEEVAAVLVGLAADSGVSPAGQR